MCLIENKPLIPLASILLETLIAGQLHRPELILTPPFDYLIVPGIISGCFSMANHAPLCMVLDRIERTIRIHSIESCFGLSEPGSIMHNKSPMLDIHIHYSLRC